MPGALARLDARIARRKAERDAPRPKAKKPEKTLSAWQRQNRAQRTLDLASWRAGNPPGYRKFAQSWASPKDHPRWRGGTFVNHAGYRMIRVDGRYRLEHRVVVERQLGRALMPWETVHHKNGVRTDNRPDNLEHRSSRHGPGQRVEDVGHVEGRGNPFWRLASRPRHLTCGGQSV